MLTKFSDSLILELTAQKLLPWEKLRHIGWTQDSPWYRIVLLWWPHSRFFISTISYLYWYFRNILILNLHTLILNNRILRKNIYKQLINKIKKGKWHQNEIITTVLSDITVHPVCTHSKKFKVTTSLNHHVDLQKS